MQHGIKRQYLSTEAKNSKLQKDQVKIKNYKSLVNEIFQCRDENLYNNDTFKLTTQCLQINPEFYTMWNYRREILLQLNEVDLLRDDLVFLLALLRKYPKCYWIWNHRMWCLAELMSLNKADWDFEFKTISKLLDLDERNFHGWEYRRYVIRNMKKDKSEQEISEIDTNEFDYTTMKINNNFSNFSAWHQRATTIKVINQKSIVECLNNELELIKTGIFMSPEDTSIWYYFKFLLTDEFFKPAVSEGILQDQLSIIHEVNELEKDDTGKDNVECLKMIIFLKDLLNHGDTKEILEKLIDLDSLRKGRYLEQINNL